MGPTVLIVDDEAPICDNLAAYLEDDDLRMPGMDGLDVMRELHEVYPELPVIAVSGTGVLNDAMDALRAGAWDIVVKPIRNMAVLEHAVTGALLKARPMRDNHRYQQDLEQANRTLRDNLQQMREDADAARRIQRQIMPERKLNFGPYEVSRCLLPSMVMSGDFVDYFAIDPGQFTLTLFSDGILEVLPGESLEHKQSRLLKALVALDNDADGLIASLGLSSGRAYPDDITLLLLKREHRPAMPAR
jgi:serine phosphatase RsbU (regulator of sigma subunit)